MTAPRSTAEIEEDCVRIVGPKHRAAVVQQIADLQQLCREYPKPFPGYRTDNKTLYEDVRRFGERYAKALMRADPLAMFSPDGPLFPDPKNPKPAEIEALSNKVEARGSAHLAEVSSMVKRARAILDLAIGADKHEKIIVQRAARGAIDLCELADLPLSYNDEHTNLQQLARLLIETATGQQPDKGVSYVVRQVVQSYRRR